MSRLKRKRETQKRSKLRSKKLKFSDIPVELVPVWIYIIYGAVLILFYPEALRKPGLFDMLAAFLAGLAFLAISMIIIFILIFAFVYFMACLRDYFIRG
jgi:hypothetical protein